ncbi:sigma-54-dependent transcriptional regulator [Falsiroseomonas sp.]|uniref:sigma-54-dependent transcriptional regulator n=1 Tax=Falsiroseomonas sp. TaxID=2870721 RepID=UPI0035686366
MNTVAGASVVMIEDDPVLGRSLVQRLRLAGVTTHWARTAAEGEVLLRRHRPTMVLCDICLPDGSGEALIAQLMPELGDVPVVAMTAYGGIEQAVRLMRAGVDDYLAKPFPVQQLLDKVAAFSAGALAPVTEGEGSDAGWGSPQMQKLRDALERLAADDSPVLLIGESGAGKGVALRRMHGLSRRSAEPFVVVDCASLPAETAEAEAVLLGRDGGAAPPEGEPGLAERAGAGTLFLDEVAELALPLQARLLRLVDERRFRRVGGRDERPLHARLVAATNADLEAKVAAGTFRQDLWFRLSGMVLTVPPLRERPQDIEALAQHFLTCFSAARGKEGVAFAEDAAARLTVHPWPGNTRELRNRIQRAVLLAGSAHIGVADLFPEHAVEPAARSGAELAREAGHAAEERDGAEDNEDLHSLAEIRKAAEREHIRRVLERCGGRVGDAARALGVSRTTLWERMRRLEVPSR